MLEVLPKYVSASKEQKERGEIIRDNISQIQSKPRANKKATVYGLRIEGKRDLK